MCSSTELVRYLDLGDQPPADQFRTAEQISSEPIVLYPLEVYLCETCGLSQLGYVVSPEILYQQDYPYESSTTASGRAHFAAFAHSVVTAFALRPGQLAVDIGSNVGVLLAGFAKEGLRIRGVDPAPNIASIAEQRGIPTIVGFFSPEVARKIVDDDGRATVITATNVFAHVDDLASFMDAIQILLDDDGIFVIEAPSFLNLVRDLEYDTIYHEHLTYLSALPLIRFFGRFGMELFDIQEVDIHGGSMRLFIARSGRSAMRDSVGALMRREEHARIHELSRLNEFAKAVERNRDQLRDLLYRLKRNGARLAAVSAPAKGMTLLNYARLGTDVLDFATEKSTLKIGRYTPGAHIPVVADDELIRRRPEYALLLAWNFADEIMRNLDAYRQQGGRFIVPIPEPRIVKTGD
jgi:SAM-dependent methyltransferase